MGSVCSLSEKYGFRCAHEDLKIQPRGPCLRVPEVEANHFVKLHSAAAIDLPQAGHSWFCFQNSAPMPDVIGFHFIRQGRPRANQRHVPSQNMEELGKFIQARPPQNGSNTMSFGRA